MKRLSYILAVCLGAAFLLSSCEKEPYGAPEKSKYIYDIPQTDLPGDAIIGAYYTDYTAAAVPEAKSPETPLLGFYTTADEGVMESHVEWADRAGLDFFLFDWNASSANDTLIRRFNDALSSGGKVRYALRYHLSHLNLSNDEPLESTAKYKAFLTDFVDVLSGYLQSESYYKIDGRPVLVVTATSLSSSTLLSANFNEAIPRLRADLKNFYGVDPYIIGEMTTGWTAPVNYADHQVYAFDGTTLNAWRTNYYDRFYGFFSFLDLNWANWQATLSKRGVDFIPCIYPSYNDRVNSPSSYYYTFSADGDPGDYVKFCNVAKRNIGSKGVVLINSWNDWVYGTNLEPSNLKEERFLDVTRSQFKK